LGPTPKHAPSVALILSLHTGLVSPQFHCQYDDLFHQAMKQADKKESLKAMEGDYEIFPRDKLPKEALVLPHIWQLRRKRVTKTEGIRK
jgi:hypothetical protein